MTKVRPVRKIGFERVEGDFYPTPVWVTECLLSKVGTAWPGLGALLRRWRHGQGSDRGRP